MIITIDGMDFSGKTTLIYRLKEITKGTVAQKATAMGIIPKEIEERINWYNNASSKEIVRSVIQSDMLRREGATNENYFFIDRGEITVISDCITKTMIRESWSYSKAYAFVKEIEQKENYFPDEHLRIYLKTTDKDMNQLEQRKINREGSKFSQFEKEYYPALQNSLQIQAKQKQHLEVNAMQSLEKSIIKIMKYI